VAQQSKGIEEVASDFPTNVLSYSNLEEAVNLILRTKLVVSSPSSVRPIQRQIDEDVAGIRRWIGSWNC
jgi:hypothetical protein